MRFVGKVLLLALLLIPIIANAATPQSGVEAFNKSMESATRSMSNAGIMALWEDDGVSLLPSTAPIVGKKAIGKMLDHVVAMYPGGKMKKFEMQCHDINISGDLASEWCSQHSVVQYPGGKPPFDSWGKMLLVLHRGADGNWRVKQEMWNQAAPK
jgi:ketosteroid isomerase-like protein